MTPPRNIDNPNPPAPNADPEVGTEAIAPDVDVAAATTEAPPAEAPASVAVKVPGDHGDEVSISYAGDPPTTYTVTDGVAQVEPERLERFLSVIPGATTTD